MDNGVLIAVLLGLMAVAYQLGLTRSRIQAGSGQVDRASRPHSRPQYHATLVALWCGIPALLVLGLWSWIEPSLIRTQILAMLPPEMAGKTQQELTVLLRRIGQIASGFGVSDQPSAFELAAAAEVNRMQSTAQVAKITLLAALALGGLAWARSRISPNLRARNQVEMFVRLLMFLSSVVAILTTVGIVMSMFTEAMRFFTFVSPVEFFFGTRFDPRFSTTGVSGIGSFGMLPLLAGTFMVSAVAMMVAIPIGLMTAVFMAEYARPKFRASAKPVLELLAGIPTIVYGVFALIVVGPFFSSAGEMVGLDIRATSAFTAGFVMGIMLIPFISSLSDDIITQVPRSLRDASLGLGATKSETIRQVVLPAALPGIVGAILLAASRAIGETMIVVLAAGNAPVLQANPFEAVSTMTVTIVNQLTGDQDFASPQSLVAFALGLTLFVITLCLNVVALYIVRKYREQYD